MPRPDHERPQGKERGKGPHRGPGGGIRGGQGPGGRRGGSNDLGPCPDTEANLKAALEQIAAPYNFVPLADWVHCPDWGPRASHDLPFEAGLCGEIPFTLVAETPLLVGGPQKKATDDAPGEVHFVKTPGGYAIPGSALRGMLRSVIEIAAFGRMRQVDDARHGLRDVSSRAVKDAYHAKVRTVKAGFLKRADDGGRVIIPCQFALLSHRDLEAWWGEDKPIFKKRTDDRTTTVADKYSRWEGLCERHGIADPYLIDVNIDDAKVTGLGGGVKGYPVLTGQISDSSDDKKGRDGTWRRGKYRDYVFFARDQSRAFSLSNADWRAFLLIHGDEEGRAEMSWPGYWRERFHQGQEVPVFYLEDGLDSDHLYRYRLGLAYMPKLAWDYSVHDLIRHTSDAHLADPGSEGHGGLDMADLLFGALHPNQDQTLKGRVSCGLALAEGDPQPETLPDTILNGPKPTYFPNYLRQRVDKEGRLASQEYATCIQTQQNRRPELRGYKRYPVRPEAQVQSLTADQKGNTKVQIRLHPLPAGSRFRGRIHFHNLLPAELGALIWALTWGGDETLRHSLGMGKPFGLGQVRFEIDWEQSDLRRNKAPFQSESLDPHPYQAAFTQHMSEAWKSERRAGQWGSSEQMANLMAMANPTAAEQFPAPLRHMRLQRCDPPDGGRIVSFNEFQWAKQPPPLVLLDYAQATGSTPSAGGAGGRPKHPWLAEQIPALAKAHNIPKPEDVWGGKRLAEAWQAIDDAEIKAAVLEEIRAHWQAQDWWDDPPKGAKRKAKAIYDG